MRPLLSSTVLVTTQPFFFRAPAIAPRTLWYCQSSALPSCSMVAPSGRRNIDSSLASLVVLAGFELFLPCAVEASWAAGDFFFAIVGSFAVQHRPSYRLHCIASQP